jgi:hypothetical protein
MGYVIQLTLLTITFQDDLPILHALALLTPDSQEKEIELFTNELRRVISATQKQLGSDKPS